MTENTKEKKENIKTEETPKEVNKTENTSHVSEDFSFSDDLSTIEIPKNTKSTKKEGPKKKKKGPIKHVIQGSAFIKVTYNNTIVTLADQNGNVLAWSSAGVCGFRGPKKSTPYAASVIVRDVSEKVKKYGLKDLNVFVRGVGSGREAAVRALNANGFNIFMIKDTTPLPHNGCRAKKPRRV